MKALLLLILINLSVALRYAKDDPADTALVDANRPVDQYGRVIPTAGKVYVVKPNETDFLLWEEVACNTTILKQYLELDATIIGKATYVNQASHGHGPCCLNQHHYVCQIMIRDINECVNMVGKFENQQPTSCPPN